MAKHKSPPPPLPDPWPPLWARKIGFLFGLALCGWEAGPEHSQHLFLYGVGFLFTGLPVARGLDKLFDTILTLMGKR